MSHKRILPLVMQPTNTNDWICTASCVSMVFQTESFQGLDLPIDQHEIARPMLCTTPTFPQERYCGNIEALRTLKSFGIDVSFVAVSNPVAALQICQKNGIEAILSLRYSSKTAAHAVLISYMDDRYAYVNDPLDYANSANPEKTNQNKRILKTNLRTFMASLKHDKNITRKMGAYV